MGNIDFLLECEKRGREQAAAINPCADTGDQVKTAILARADQFKACADELSSLKGADSTASNNLFEPISSKYGSPMNIVERCRRIAAGSHPDLADLVCADAADEIETLRGRIELLERGFPVIKVLGHVVNHMEHKDGAIILKISPET